jgi:O-acetyl-ADP-ribose deacetylase (regulator of RNase III)
MIDILYILQSTVKFSLKIKESESIEAKKKIEKLRKDGVHITSDEQTNQVECEGTEAQVATARQVQQAKYMTEVHLGMVQQSTGGRNRKIACVEMTEDDYAALLCFPEVFCYVKSHRYQNVQALFETNRPDITDGLIQMIQSKIHELNQLTTTEVIPPNQFEDQFPAIQKQVEQLDTGIFCFLSFDKKRIIIKANGYEQVQQAKYMTEVHLGMVQQSAGRRNRKIASPDDYGSAGPSVSQSSVSDPSVKDSVCFTTKEGIRIYVYCAGIGHLEVDVLVNAANKDLQHGGGIAYHISRAAGYDFDKECDDYIRDHGPLDVGTCCSTTAGKLPYHNIIHAVGPMWHSYPHDGKQKCLDDLKMTILSALKEAHKNQYKSIAIPSISSGKYLQ